MPHAIALVTVPNLSTNGKGETRKRGFTVRELRVKADYTHVSLKQLRRLVENAIKREPGNLTVACRQVDLYISGQLVASWQPLRTPLIPIEHEELTSELEYRQSLKDAADDARDAAFAELGDADSLQSLTSDLREPDAIRDMLREFKPISTIFGQHDLGDRLASALESCG